MLRITLLLLALLLPALAQDPLATTEPVAASVPPPVRVFLDAGHGAPGNSGNEDAACRDEQDVMLSLSDHVVAGLQGTGRFQVLPSRQGAERPEYDARIAAAAAFGADVFVSLHSDARGSGVAVPVDGRSCVQNPAEPGFAVLWSDEGPLAEERHDLARRVAAAMIAQGFLAYDGADYGGLYAVDPDAPGVFVDRHRPERRIRLLRRPAMPSILIETHHAWHPVEADAWQQAATRDRLVAALAAALGPDAAAAE